MRKAEGGGGVSVERFVMEVERGVVFIVGRGGKSEEGWDGGLKKERRSHRFTRPPPPAYTHERLFE